jgi:rod shape determining protein RodA
MTFTVSPRPRTGPPATDPAAPLWSGLLPLRGRPRTRRRLDWLLVAAALALALVGAVLVWSATRSQLIAQHQDPQSYLYRHLLNMAIGAVLVVAAARVDARLLRLAGPLLYLASLVGLLAVFVVGSTVNGAHAWIVVGGGFEFQPAEFTKLGLIIGMAIMFAGRAAERPAAAPSRADILIAIGMIAVPLVLIMLQPDLGSAMVVCVAGFGVLIAAGVPARWTIGLIVVGVLGVILAAKVGVLAEYQLDRFRAFVNPGADVQGAAYNVNQAHIAIMNGHLFGTGLFRGPQTNGAFVPEQQTDFVFSVAGEELGFAGSSAIIALFGLLCWRGLRIALAADHAGRLIASGIVCWFGFQAFQNIGMNLGLTPVTGLPLPFVSYGGSSMFAQSLAIGLLLAIQRQAATHPAD